MAHLDTNDNEQYDFVDSEGEEDGPYTTDEGDEVIADASLTVEGGDTNGNDGDMDETEGTDGDGAGFGAVAALVAVVASVLAARRLN